MTWSPLVIITRGCRRSHRFEEASESASEPERELQGGSCRLPRSHLPSAGFWGFVRARVWNPWMLEVLKRLRVQPVSGLFPAIAAGFWRNN